MKIKSKKIIEYSDLPGNLKNYLQDYYAGTDHRPILNDSYTRYPYLFSLEDETNETPFNAWLDDNGIKQSDYHVIIHWDW